MVTSYSSRLAELTTNKGVSLSYYSQISLLLQKPEGSIDF